MKTKPQQKLLVPVDGSDRSLNTVRYVAGMDCFRRMRVVLLHVFGAVPESYWDLEKDPRSTATVNEVRAWQLEQRKQMDRFMDRAQKIMVNSGCMPDRIQVKIQNRKEGFARDIIREAQKGYSAVVSRRRGMTGLRGIVLGSVANKLVEKLSFLPLLLVGRREPGKKILIGFDGSEGSLRAVDFVGGIMSGQEVEVKLIHVLRGKEDKDPRGRRLYSPGKYAESVRKEVTAQLADAEKRLVKLGLEPHRVSIEVVGGVASRAGAIVAEAVKENVGTLVMGRRGRSRVQDFFIGRVTNKVIYLARDRTVWIVR